MLRTQDCLLLSSVEAFLKCLMLLLAHLALQNQYNLARAQQSYKSLVHDFDDNSNNNLTVPAPFNMNKVVNVSAIYSLPPQQYNPLQSPALIERRSTGRCCVTKDFDMGWRLDASTTARVMVMLETAPDGWLVQAHPLTEVYSHQGFGSQLLSSWER